MKQVIFDEGSAQFVLDVLKPHSMDCPACGELVDADSFGGAAMLDDHSHVWHKTLPCLLALSILLTSRGS